MIKKLILSILFLVIFTVGAHGQASTPLTLDRVVSTYVERNLELQAARYRLERTKADQIAARLRPNPGLTVTAENFVINGPVPFDREYEVAMTYSETIELGGKRKLRQQVADATVSAAEAQFADAMRRGMASVKRLYYEAVLARYNVEIATENRQMFGQLLQVNESRFQEGAIPEGELIKVRLERIKFDAALRQTELKMRQAVIRLLEQLGESSFARQEVSGEMNFAASNLTLESLRQQAVAERSDIQAAMRGVDAAEQRLALEHARSRPDLTPFVGYKRLGMDNSVLFGVSMPLRLRDRNQAGIGRAETDLKSAQTELQLVKNRAMAEVEHAYEAFEAAQEQVQTFRSELLDQAEESRMIALAAYEEGGSDLLPFLEAQRTRSEIRQQYFNTLFDYQSSLIDLELAVGREVQP